MTTYNEDFYLWTLEQAALLRKKDASALDWENLAEEIENAGKHERILIRGHLRDAIAELLKWNYDPELDRHLFDWEPRTLLQEILKDNPSLRESIHEFIGEVYQSARTRASRSFMLPLENFPETCPFTVEQILGDWLPEADA